MSSLKPLEAGAAQAPKRLRGRIRVAAIMDSAVQLFAEKGYDTATMTEIAAHSGTAIGSLYRFFPNKEALADALLLRYAQHVLGGFEELAEQAPAMTLDALAGALVDFMLALHSERSIAIALADARAVARGDARWRGAAVAPGDSRADEGEVGGDGAAAAASVEGGAGGAAGKAGGALDAAGGDSRAATPVSGGGEEIAEDVKQGGPHAARRGTISYPARPGR